MQAKCPFCETGCEQCSGGYTDVRMATGNLFTRHCPDCGRDNGGYIVEEGRSLPARSRWEPGICVWCKGTNVEWLEIGEVG
jgi:hypothetical protein